VTAKKKLFKIIIHSILDPAFNFSLSAEDCEDVWIKASRYAAMYMNAPEQMRPGKYAGSAYKISVSS